MHVCIRTTDDFSLHSAIVNNDFRSGQKWYISEIRLPAKIVKQTKEKWFQHHKKMIENHFKRLPGIFCSSENNEFMSAELSRNFPDGLRTQ